MDERAQVVTLHNSTMKIDEIKELLLKKIHHTYLADFIEAPYIDEDKLNILLIIMNNTPLSDKQKRHWIVATMLVQIALDTHELVPVTSSADESEFKTSSRQLTVLAGDYFSGLYYLLLAETEDIKLVQILSSAIKEINEYKMILYYNEAESLDDFVMLVKHIESLLIIRVAEYVNNTTMNQVIVDLLGTNKLIQEQGRFTNRMSSSLLNDWLKNSSQTTKLDVINQIELIIQTNLDNLKETLSTLPIKLSSHENHIDYMLSTLINNHTLVVEEG